MQYIDDSRIRICDNGDREHEILGGMLIVTLLDSGQYETRQIEMIHLGMMISGAGALPNTVLSYPLSCGTFLEGIAAEDHHEDECAAIEATLAMAGYPQLDSPNDVIRTLEQSHFFDQERISMIRVGVVLGRLDMERVDQGGGDYVSVPELERAMRADDQITEADRNRLIATLRDREKLVQDAEVSDPEV